MKKEMQKEEVSRKKPKAKDVRIDSAKKINTKSKMENAISKIEGVESANVSFMTQKMTICADEEKFDKIMKQAVKICKKIQPIDCTLPLNSRAGVWAC